jgi:FxsC-like protein
LSYAHADADGLLKGFSSDLSEAVARRLRIAPPAGFLDENDILVGMDWSDRLGEALRKSLVLVCLISKEYLKSENCGRELEVFLKRRALLPADANAEVILPVFWESPAVAAQFPSSLSSFQYSDTSLPEPYLTWGARSIAIKREVDSKREDDPYQQLLASLSIKIASAAIEYRLPEIAAEQMAAFGKLPNALLPSAPLAPANSNSNAGRVFEINFVYAIPAAGEFPQAPPREGYSANGGWYWQPFRSVDEGIGQLVYQAPTKYRRHEHTVIQKDLVDELIARGKQDQLVILLVDPWAVFNPDYLEFFRKFDESVVPNSAVIAVGTDDDFENKLTEAFENSYPRLKDTPYFKCGVAAKESLLQALNSTLDKLIDNIVKRRRSGNRFPGPELRHLTPPGRVA